MLTPRMRLVNVAIWVVCAMTWCAGVGAQAIPGTGYSFLKEYAETNRFRLGNPGSFQVMPDGSGVLFLRAAGPRTFLQELWWFDVATAQEQLLLTPDALLGGAEEELSAEEKARRERARSSSRGISSYELSKDGARLLVPLSGRLFVVDVASARMGKKAIRARWIRASPMSSPTTTS